MNLKRRDFNIYTWENCSSGEGIPKGCINKEYDILLLSIKVIK